MRYGNAPHGVLWDGTVDNRGLIDVVTGTARESWPLLKWDPALKPDRLPLLCWLYVRECTDYIPERGVQFVRTPWAFVREQVGDCKSTAVFIGSMCRAAGLPVKLRFAMLPGSDYFGHVWAMINGVDVDPLLNYGAACFALQTFDVSL